MAQETAPPCGPVSKGDCLSPEKMEKRTCALCPEGHEWSVIYFAPSANIAAHENCLLYSSGLVECEPHETDNPARNFAVQSVKKEIRRGKRLKCSLCHKGGATVGCDLSYCRKSYHYVCAKRDHATLQVDGHHGTYKIFCPEHPPQKEETTECADNPIMKKTGRKKRLSSGPPTEPKKMKYSSYKRLMKEEPHGHKDAAVKAPFLKKCQEAGLLTELFEQILEKIDSIHGRFMDETASESDYEGIETLLFDCGLFGDILRKFQEVIKSKTCEYEERLSQMKQKLEALADLQTLCPFQEYGDLNLSSSTSGSLLLPEDHQFRYQESPEVQAGSGDSL